MGFLQFLSQLLRGESAASYAARRSRGAGQSGGGDGVRRAESGGSRDVQRETGVMGLEADQFAPLSTSGAHATIADMGGVKSAYLDSTRLIPDASLPRIQVIDRTMVGAGLITADDLVKIHEVGAEYSSLRGGAREFHVAAQQAVTLDRDARAALKAQKKAEAAQKRQRHIEDVARRKATDIVFLGRGVSGGLSDRRVHVEALKNKGLQVLATPAELASAMGLSVGRLRFLSFHSDAPTRTHYVSFCVPKKSGGTRVITAPHRDMKAAQRWVLENVLERLDVHGAAHGFLPGRSILTNARPHVGTDILVNIDLQDFFGTITFPRVRGLYRGLGYSPAVATILALLTTEAPRRALSFAGEMRFAATGPRALPQGAPSSPAISNLIARKLDQRCQGIAKKLGWTYTRYADDLSFSSLTAENPEGPTQIGYLLARLRHIAQDEGFRVNESKTRIQRQNARQTVTGLVVNDHVAVPRPTVRRLRAILHKAKTEGLAAQNRDGHPDFEGWLRGMIAHVEMVQQERGRVLRRAFEALPS